MELLWSPVVAAGGNQWQIGSAPKPQKQANPSPWVATSCLSRSMVRRGRRFESARGLRQSACKSALCGCLLVEHADTKRTHLGYERRIAASRGAFRHLLADDGRGANCGNLLLSGTSRCQRGRDLDPLSVVRGSLDALRATSAQWTGLENRFGPLSVRRGFKSLPSALTTPFLVAALAVATEMRRLR
jgi:hypothetical protein